MVKKKYLFFDIDGTLVAGGYEHTYVPDSAREALKKMAAAGHFLCIATGRAQALAVDYMHELGFKNMVSDGGYGVTIDDQLLGIRPLVREDIIALVEECKEKGFAWGIQVDNSDTRLVPDECFMEESRDEYMKSRIVHGLDPNNYPNLYKAFIAGPYPVVENTIKTLDRLPWCRYHDTYLFVEPLYKSVGIKTVMDHFHADYADAIVFGDSLNDMSMFIDDWTKVAMGNAVPELKAKADYVTNDVKENGIYNICEKLGLFEPVDES